MSYLTAAISAAPADPLYLMIPVYPWLTIWIDWVMVVYPIIMAYSLRIN